MIKKDQKALDNAQQSIEKISQAIQAQKKTIESSLKTISRTQLKGGENQKIKGMSISPNNSTGMVFFSDGFVEFIDIEKGTKANPPVRVFESACYCGKFVDKEHIAMLGVNSNGKTECKIMKYSHQNEVYKVEDIRVFELDGFNPNNKYQMAVDEINGAVGITNYKKLYIMRKINNHYELKSITPKQAVKQISLSEGAYLFLLYSCSEVAIANINTLKPICNFNQTKLSKAFHVVSMESNPETKNTLLGNENGLLYIFDSKGKLELTIETPCMEALLTINRIKDTSYHLITTETGLIFLFDAKNKEIIYVFEHASSREYPAEFCLQNGVLLAVKPDRSALTYIKFREQNDDLAFAHIREVQCMDDEIVNTFFRGNRNELIFMTKKGEPRIFSVEHEQVVHKLQPSNIDIKSGKYEICQDFEDENLLVITDKASKIEIYNTQTQEQTLIELGSKQTKGTIEKICFCNTKLASLPKIVKKKSEEFKELEGESELVEGEELPEDKSSPKSDEETKSGDESPVEEPEFEAEKVYRTVIALTSDERAVVISLEEKKPLQSIPLNLFKEGKITAVASSKGFESIVYFGTEYGNLYGFNLCLHEKQYTFQRVHHSPIFNIKFSDNNENIVTTGTDGKLSIVKSSIGQLVYAYKGLSQEPTEVFVEQSKGDYLISFNSQYLTLWNNKRKIVQNRQETTKFGRIINMQMIDSKQAYVVFEKHPTTLFEMDVNAQDDTVKLIYNESSFPFKDLGLLILDQKLFSIQDQKNQKSFARNYPEMTIKPFDWSLTQLNLKLMMLQANTKSVQQEGFLIPSEEWGVIMDKITENTVDDQFLTSMTEYIENGSLISFRDEVGNTAVHYIFEKKSSKFMSHIIEKGNFKGLKEGIQKCVSQEFFKEAYKMMAHAKSNYEFLSQFIIDLSKSSFSQLLSDWMISGELKKMFAFKETCIHRLKLLREWIECTESVAVKKIPNIMEYKALIDQQAITTLSSYSFKEVINAIGKKLEKLDPEDYSFIYMSQKDNDVDFRDVLVDHSMIFRQSSVKDSLFLFIFGNTTYDLISRHIPLFVELYNHFQQQIYQTNSRTQNFVHLLIQNKQLSFVKKIELLRTVIGKFNIKPCVSIGNVIPLTQLINNHGFELNNNVQEYTDIISALTPLAPADQDFSFLDTYYMLMNLKLTYNAKIQRNSSFMAFQNQMHTIEKLKKGLLNMCIKGKYLDLLDYLLNEKNYFELDDFYYQSPNLCGHTLQLICQSKSQKMIDFFFEKHLKYTYEKIDPDFHLSDSLRKEFALATKFTDKFRDYLSYSIFDEIMDLLTVFQDTEVVDSLSKNFDIQWEKEEPEIQQKVLTSLTYLPNHPVSKGYENALVPVFIKGLRSENKKIKEFVRKNLKAFKPELKDYTELVSSLIEQYKLADEIKVVDGEISIIPQEEKINKEAKEKEGKEDFEIVMNDENKENKIENALTIEEILKGDRDEIPEKLEQYMLNEAKNGAKNGASNEKSAILASSQSIQVVTQTEQ